MTTKGKHLTIEDRNYIEDALNENHSLVSIANHMGKDPTTISKEIKRTKVPFGKLKHMSMHIIKMKLCAQREHCMLILINVSFSVHVMKKTRNENCIDIKNEEEK